MIGADPGTILAAVTPVPDTLSEYQFAGLLRGKKVELVDCKTVPLKVPAEAEIVLEGHVSLDDYGDEGPTAITPATTTASRSSRCSPLSAITMRQQSDLSLDLHRPAARRAVGAGRGAERGVHPAASSSSSRRSSISGCRPKAAAIASPWCR